MIEKYLDYDTQERFQEIRLELGGKDWESDEWFINHLLDYYDDFQLLKSKYKKLIFKYKMLKYKFKTFFNFYKLLFDK